MQAANCPRQATCCPCGSKWKHTKTKRKQPTHFKCGIMTGKRDYLQMLDVGCKHRICYDTKEYTARSAGAVFFRRLISEAILYLPGSKTKTQGGEEEGYCKSVEHPRDQEAFTRRLPRKVADNSPPDFGGRCVASCVDCFHVHCVPSFSASRSTGLKHIMLGWWAYRTLANGAPLNQRPLVFLDYSWCRGSPFVLWSVDKNIGWTVKAWGEGKLSIREMSEQRFTYHAAARGKSSNASNSDAIF